ncbi:MAG: alginate export family protein [Deltaproteobacteria bacterium]|nr:alginate export family protein [Deltaproteobacteria bacterium]
MKFGSRFLMPLVGLSVLAMQTPAFAADVLTVSGHARTRMSIDDNINTTTTPNAANATDTNSVEQWNSRVRMNMDLAPSSSVKVRITPQFTHQWAANANDGNTARAGTFTTHEAWMAWMPNNMVSLTIGRQILSYGSELIVGANDWGTFGNAFDAVKARFHHNMGTSDFFFAKTVENSAGNTPDNDFWGLYNTLKVGNQFVSTADVYAFWNDQRNHGATRSRIATLGVRAMGAQNGFDYDAELAYQAGKANSIDKKGLMIDGDVSTKFMNRHRVGLGFGYANTEWTEQFPTRHGKMGDADVIARNNVMNLAIMTNWMWNDQWTAKVNGYWFMRASTGSNNTPNTAAGYTMMTGNSDRNLGMEADLVVSYKADKALGFDLGYAMFKPMSALDKSSNTTRYNQTASRTYLQAMVNF